MSEKQNLSESPVAASLAEKFGKSETPAPAPTLGQRRVRRNFNPSSNVAVEDLKDIQARFIDYLEALRGRAEELTAEDKNEYHRLIDLAQTSAEEAAMWATAEDKNEYHRLIDLAQTSAEEAAMWATAEDKGEYLRLIDLAQTTAEEAAMWAVKAVTI